jgi:mono/diheme cytochrome c family protein
VRRRRRLRVVILVPAALLLAGCHEIFPQRTEGERLYRKLCAQCHGVDASGNTPRYMGTAAADLLDNHWNHGGGEGDIKHVIREGVFGSMPGNPDLTEDQVDAIYEHLMALRERARG